MREVQGHATVRDLADRFFVVIQPIYAIRRPLVLFPAQLRVEGRCCYY